MKFFTLLFVSLAACLTASAAELKLASPFADHMVLQRDTQVPVWGWADPGAKITVEFAGQKKTATADAAGKWTVTLDPLPASEESRTLTVTGPATITVQDVLVGEVWLASGQSNMGFPLSASHNADTEIPAANDPLLRFFTVAKAVAPEPQTELKGKWDPTTPKTAPSFSGVAYFFAKELRATLKVPVAVLHASWGGTPAQAWMSLDALRQDPPFAKHLKTWDDALAKHEAVKANPQLVTDYEASLQQWKTEVQPAFDAALREYNAAMAAGTASGPKPTPARPEPENPDPMAIPSPSKRPNTPSVIYNAQIAPLIPYAMRGVIWYQGEANASGAVEYRTLFPRLITDWRTRWGSDFPFLFVQLSSWEQGTKPADQHDWPWLREAQTHALKLPNTAMAVTLDVGNPRDVHPKDKLDVGLRLARAARATVYGESLVGSGPTYRSHTFADGKARITFDHTGAGLTIGQAPWLAPKVDPLPTDKLLGFVIAGDDRRWVEADAVIEGDTVIVSHPSVPQPVAVRYAWANAPKCNLYNKDGLPAGTFRTDAWPKP